MSLSLELTEIRCLLPEAEVSGAIDTSIITGISNLSDAQPGDLSFLSNLKYKKQAYSSKASVLLLPLNFDAQPQVGQTFFFIKDPSRALAKICELLEKNFIHRIHPEFTQLHSLKILRRWILRYCRGFHICG